MHEQLAMCVKLNSGVQNFSHLVLGAYFQIGGRMKEGEVRKTGYISETVRDRAKVTIIWVGGVA